MDAEVGDDEEDVVCPLEENESIDRTPRCVNGGGRRAP
jgi:hypothetical protein